MENIFSKNGYDSIKNRQVRKRAGEEGRMHHTCLAEMCTLTVLNPYRAESRDYRLEDVGVDARIVL
jgi:hypothetical protein